MSGPHQEMIRRTVEIVARQLEMALADAYANRKTGPMSFDVHCNDGLPTQVDRLTGRIRETTKVPR